MAKSLFDRFKRKLGLETKPAEEEKPPTYFDRVAELIEPRDNFILFESLEGKPLEGVAGQIYKAARSDTRFAEYYFYWSIAKPNQTVRDLVNDEKTISVKRANGAHFRAASRSKHWIIEGELHEDLMAGETHFCWQVPAEVAKSQLSADELEAALQWLLEEVQHD